jgi:cytochrome c peroxidase
MRGLFDIGVRRRPKTSRRATWLIALVACSAIGGAGFAQLQTHGEQPSREPFAPLPTQPTRMIGDTAKVALGHDLFFDRRISRSKKLSCATCHDLRTNGASRAKVDRGDSGQLTDWNTPTVFNNIYNFRLGWAGKTRNLNDFTRQTISAPHLMGGNGLTTRRLSTDPAMLLRFRRVYGDRPSDANVADALTAFMATLVTTDAPLDQWLRGDKDALNAQQLRGFVRFKMLGCASCHQGVNIGGNLFQRRGIFHPLGKPKPEYLRVPSLRNVAVTAPYFHDGGVATLPEAIRQMARAQLDLTISDRDASDIAAFLATLTGKYQGRRLRPATPNLPR